MNIVPNLKTTFIIALFSIFILASLAFAATKYTCYRYVNNEPTGGFVNVYADSEEEANRKAYQKYKDLGYSLDYCKCKTSW